MSLRVVQTPESLADIALQADYYAQRENVALAQRFIEAIKTTVRLLASHPWLGKETHYDHPKLADIRFFLVRKPFDKHLIFYRVSGSTLDIIRVIHGLRDLPRELINPSSAE